MKFDLSLLRFPLFARELTGLSAGRRTHVIRTIYAAIAYGLALWFYLRWQRQFDPNSFEILGGGRNLFLLIVRFQFWSIYLVMPLLTCGAIADERERQTLDLLRLTKLGSWRILLEKLASRLVVMGTFLLIPVPLAAIAYTLGGFDADEILRSACVLSETALQVGSFCLLCSAWFRTSTTTTLAAYSIGAAILWSGSYLGIAVLSVLRGLGLFEVLLSGLSDADREWFLYTFGTKNDQPLFGSWVFGFRGTDLWDAPFQSTLLVDRFWFTVNNFDVVQRSTTETAICSIPLLVSTVLFLVVARWLVWRSPSKATRGLADSLMSARAGQKIRFRTFTLQLLTPPVGSPSLYERILRATGKLDLPKNRPIAWRETRPLLTRRMVARDWIVLAEILIVLWLVWAALRSSLHTIVDLDSLMSVIWLAACLVVVVVASGLIPQERSLQTLEVLLTTPLTTSEIVLEKLASIRRLISLLCLPLLTVLTLQFLFWVLIVLPATYLTEEYEVMDERAQFLWMFGHVLRWICRVTAIPIYLSVVGWIGFQFGFRLKNQLRAVLAASAVTVAACAAPIVTREFLSTFDQLPITIRTLTVLCDWINPLWILFSTDVAGATVMLPFLKSDVLPPIWFPLLFHFLAVGGMLWGIRRNALKQFARFVHRADPPDVVRTSVRPSRQPDENVRFEI